MKTKHNAVKQAISKLATACLVAIYSVTLLFGNSMLPASAADVDLTDKSFTSMSADGKWYTDFATFEEEQEYAANHTVKIMEEGIVLLKNQNNALPFSKNVKNITLFGSHSYDLVYGGTGSGAGSGRNLPLTESLEDAGYNLNGKIRKIYETTEKRAVVSGIIGGTTASTQEIDLENLAPARNSYKFYHDALITTITRTAGEGQDLWTSDLETHSDKTEHYLELDDNEKDLINHMKEVKAEYGSPIVVLVNCANVFELGVLEDDPDIDAIVWIGQPGTTGTIAVGRVLNGTVNPSGRTVDIYPADFKNDSTYNNFVNNFAEYNKTAAPEGKTRLDYLEHEEGIYFGYKWYETAATDAVLDKIPGYNAEKATIPTEKAGDVYYNRSTGVVYPFGYGLSYTTFKQEFVTKKEAFEPVINGLSGLDAMTTVQVKVTNTGKVAGKEVVQLYVSAPYTNGGIEKASVQLVSFAKTKMLNPGESETLTLNVRLGDIASFDYNDANKNGYKGWEIEAGNYVFSIRNNSHEAIESFTVALNAHTTDLDNDTDSTNNTPLSNNDDFASLPAEGKSSMKLMTRGTEGGKSGFITTYPTASDYLYDSSMDYALSRYRHAWTEFSDDASDPWYKTVDDIPADWTQQSDEQAAQRKDGKCDIQLRDMSGLDYTDTTTKLELGKTTTVAAFDKKTPAEAWTIFMNQLTYEEMRNFLANGYFQTAALDSVGKEWGADVDGPAQLDTTNKVPGTFWCCEVVIASTWNVELAYEQGVLVGNEGLFLDVPGWYGTGVQVHRSMFQGRNYEYYSQDALQGAFIAAAVVKGAQSKGLNPYIKHFAFLAVTGYVAEFADEQNIRENHLKAYEYAVKFGGCTSMMACGAINQLSNTSNYATNVQITSEWGFKGYMVTDWYGTYAGYANFNQRSGIAIPLGKYSDSSVNHVTGKWDATKRGGKGIVMEDMKVVNDELVKQDTAIEAPTQYYAIRDSVQRILWVAANNSVIENRLDKSQIKDHTVEVKSGVKAAASVAVDAEKFGTSNVTYTITEGELPEGLTFNESTGTIEGRTNKEASATVTIQMLCDGWIKVSKKVTVKVNPLFTTDKALNAKQGEAFSATFTQDSYKKGGTFNGAEILGVSYSLRSEIPGLSWNKETNTLSGTPTEAGEYEVIVRCGVNYKGQWWNPTENIDTVYTLKVEGDGSVVPPVEDKKVEFRMSEGKLQYRLGEDGEWKDFSSGEEVGKNGKSAYEIAVDQGFKGTEKEWLESLKGANGTNGKDGVNGKDGAGLNAGAAVGISVGCSAVVAIIAALAVIALKKKKSI